MGHDQLRCYHSISMTAGVLRRGIETRWQAAVLLGSLAFAIMTVATTFPTGLSQPPLVGVLVP